MKDKQHLLELAKIARIIDFAINTSLSECQSKASLFIEEQDLNTFLHIIEASKLDELVMVCYVNEFGNKVYKITFEITPK